MDHETNGGLFVIATTKSCFRSFEPMPAARAHALPRRRPPRRSLQTASPRCFTRAERGAAARLGRAVRARASFAVAAASELAAGPDHWSERGKSGLGYMAVTSLSGEWRRDGEILLRAPSRV